MDLDDLKSAWSRYASDEAKKRVLSEHDVNTLLTARTRNISEKIGRNIRIGMGIILAWVLLELVASFLLSPFFDEILDKPYMTDQFLFWTSFIEVGNYILIFSAIIIFWIRYNKIEKSKIDASNLRDTLKRLIGILNSYKRMFYVILGIILLYSAVSFISAFFMETNYQIKEAGLNMSSLSITNWFIKILALSVSLGLFLGIYYVLFNFFFKRLYGRYLKKMEATLNELDEVNS